jgi:hypothetical protein
MSAAATTPATLTPEQRLERILQLVAEAVRPCQACGVKLYFVRHANGKLAPYTADGVNHFATCPDRDRFKKKAGE